MSELKTRQDIQSMLRASDHPVIPDVMSKRLGERRDDFGHLPMPSVTTPRRRNPANLRLVPTSTATKNSSGFRIHDADAVLPEDE